MRRCLFPANAIAEDARCHALGEVLIQEAQAHFSSPIMRGFYRCFLSVGVAQKARQAHERFAEDTLSKVSAHKCLSRDNNAMPFDRRSTPWMRAVVKR